MFVHPKSCNHPTPLINIFISCKGVVGDSTKNDGLGVELLLNLNPSLSPSKTFEVALPR
jgi:hypothetical protein